MREIVWSTTFNRETKKMHRQGKDIAMMTKILDILAQASPLPPQYLDHSLKGKWKGRRELHIAPDWLLIYHIENDTVYLDRTGSHSDLFKL